MKPSQISDTDRTAILDYKITFHTYYDRRKNYQMIPIVAIDFRRQAV